MAHWARRNRLLLVAWAVIVAVAVPIALLSRDKPVADREALVIAQRLDMSPDALPRYGETLFDNGQVAEAVAAHMLASLEEERGPLLQVYRQFRFLFPERRAAAIEEAAVIERRLLERYLADRPAHVLRHPYPVDLGSLVGPVEAAVGGRS